MNDFLYYLIKVSGAFTILYILYKVCFSSITFHALNRSFVLMIIPLSIGIPLIDIQWTTTLPIKSTNLTTLLNNFDAIESNVQEVGNGMNSLWNITDIIYYVYVLGVTFCLMKLIFSLLKLIFLKHNASTIKDGEFSIIFTDVKLVFSFLKWIFVPLNYQQNSNYSIIKHEKLHGNLWHSIDLIITELYGIVFWFNPFVYFFQKDLKTVHEYQVDAILIKNGIKKSDYLQLMLNNIAAPYKFIGLYNYFNGLTIKKRVNMITKNKNSKWQLARYLLIIPIIAIMTMSFTNTLNKSDNIPNIPPIKIEEKYHISSHFGMRNHPVLKYKKFHSGIDLKAKMGTPIIATADGIITTTEFNTTNHGNRVIINHGGGYETSYSHMREIKTAKDKKVKQGDLIGYVGITGKSSGPHLHYEVIKNGKQVNPFDYFK